MFSVSGHTPRGVREEVSLGFVVHGGFERDSSVGCALADQTQLTRKLTHNTPTYKLIHIVIRVTLHNGDRERERQSDDVCMCWNVTGCVFRTVCVVKTCVGGGGLFRFLSTGGGVAAHFW